MTAGSPNKLRHQVTLQSRSTVNDGFGQEVDTWTDVATPFADIEPALGTSQESAEAQTSSITHLLTIRFRPSVTARMRVVYGARIFEIVSVIDVEERHFWLQLQCSEGLTAG